MERGCRKRRPLSFFIGQIQHYEISNYQITKLHGVGSSFLLRVITNAVIANAVILGNAGAILRDRMRQRAENITAVIRSQQLLACAFGMRHHAEDVAVKIADPRDVR